MATPGIYSVDEDGEMTLVNVTDRPASMPPSIAAAIVAVKRQVKALGTDERNQHGGYNYVSVDKFYDRIGKLMADAGLALLIDETESDVRASAERVDKQTGEVKPGSPWLFARYELCFLHECGDLSRPLCRRIALPISGPQTFGAAQSYIEKQFLRQVFKVPTGEKDADDTPQKDAPPASVGSARGRPAGTGGAAPAASPKPATTPAAAGTQTKHERYDEAVDYYKAIKQRVAAAASLNELTVLLANDGFDPLFVMPPTDGTKAQLLLEVAPEHGYQALARHVEARKKLLAKQDSFGEESVP